MEVRLLTYTKNPEETVAVAGKGCYSAEPAYDICLTPVGIDHTLGVIHPSCYEHAVFTFSISGISRVTSHQLVRHRMASYSQQSQRYVKPKDLDKEMLFDYVTPESVSEDDPSMEQYEWAMKVINKVYKQLLGWGCPEEDARYILPNACTTSIVVTMNARELQHFCGLRRCSRAQWEIRELADRMAQAAEEACPELFRHFSLGPQCEQLGYCPEHKSCGKHLQFANILTQAVLYGDQKAAEAAKRCSRGTAKTRTVKEGRPLTREDMMTVNDFIDPNKTYAVQLGKGILGEVKKTEVTDKTSTAKVRYQRKIDYVDAVRYLGDNWPEIRGFVEYTPLGDVVPTREFGPLRIRTPNGYVEAYPGDWICRDAAGKYYPCSDDIFRATYYVDEIPLKVLEKMVPDDVKAMWKKGKE